MLKRVSELRNKASCIRCYVLTTICLWVFESHNKASCIPCYVSNYYLLMERSDCFVERSNYFLERSDRKMERNDLERIDYGKK